MTFTSPGAFLKKNYFGADEDDEEKMLLKSMLVENMLINLRTYDTHSLILYANDHMNNFAHLYISNGTTIVYLFNAGKEIKNISVEHPGKYGHSNNEDEKLTLSHTVGYFDRFRSKHWNIHSNSNNQD